MTTAIQGAVIGAGIAGISMAHALRRIGISIDIFEQSPAPRSTGYQLNVHANGKYALAQIGLLDALGNSGDGADVSSAPIIDGLTGTVVRRIAFNGTGQYSSTSFYRGDLHRALLHALEGAPPEGGREIESVSDDPRRDTVTLCFAGGEVRQFDFVIAADGAHSRFRRQLFPRHRGYVPRFDALMFATTVDLTGQSEAERLFAQQMRQREFVQINTPGTAIVLSGASGGQFGVIICTDDPSRTRGISTPEDAKRLARSLVRDVKDPRVHHAIDTGFWDPGNPFVWHIGDIDPLPQFHASRVALTGDAAHAMFPMLGQGGNQAFEDAMVLARLVNDTVNGGNASMNVVTAFERYSAERQPHVARIQTLARRSARGLISKSLFGHRLNNIGTRWLPQRILDRFSNHLLKYAIADPSCAIEALR
jgi:salicylate hydroxylase